MTPCKRNEYPEDELLCVLTTDKARLNKKYIIKSGVWTKDKSYIGKNYTYEFYHVPDLEAYRQLLVWMQKKPHSCIIFGMPKKSWKPGTVGQRDKHHIDAAHNIRFLTLDIDGPIIAGWEPGTPVKETIQMTYDMLASEFTAIADIELGALVHLTAGYGNPEGVGPRMRLSFELKDPVPTREIGLFLNELKKRYSYLMVDPALYRVGQIVYTADPDFIPPKMGYKAKRVFLKTGTKLDWQELIYGFDVQDEEYAKFSYTEASDFQKKLFMTVETAVEEAGMVRERTDRMIHIICPWEGEHSSHSCDSSTSIFQAENGMPAFKCMHASCDRRRWREFVGELQSQEILDPVALQECQHDDAVSDFKDEAIPGKKSIVYDLPPVAKKALIGQKYTLFDVKANLLFNSAANKFYDRESDQYMSAEAVRINYTVKNPHVSDRPGIYKKQDLDGVEAWKYEIPEEGIMKGMSFKGLGWEPRMETSGKLLVRDGDLLYNPYKGFGTVANTDRDISDFLNLMRRLYPDDYAYDWQMSAFAHGFQKPWEKPPTAGLHIYTVQGAGRGTAATFIHNVYNGVNSDGSSTRRNLAINVKPHELFDNSGFNEPLLQTLHLTIEEMDKPSNKIRNAVKDLMSSTSQTLNPKGQPKLINEPMYYRLWFHSNQVDALPIDHTDRRTFPYMPDHIDMKVSAEYFTKLNKLARDSEYLGSILQHFMMMDISKFNPYVAPPETSIKHVMIQSSQGLAKNMLNAIPEYLESSPMGYTESMLLDAAKLCALSNGMDEVEVYHQVPHMLREIRKWPVFSDTNYNMIIGGRSIKKKIYFFDPDKKKQWTASTPTFRKANLMRAFDDIKKELNESGLINNAHKDFKDA